jgi:outer membrane receptor protein involved in Fe transport
VFFRDADGLNVTDGRTRHRGVEASLDWQPTRALGVFGSLAWSEQTYAFDRNVGNASEVIRDGNRIDTAPEWLGNVTARWEPGGRWRGALSLEYVGKYVTDAANTRTYPGHTLTHAFIAFAVAEDLEVSVRLRNVFDVAYADRADFAFGTDRYFPGEPMNATLTLTRRFR